MKRAFAGLLFLTLSLALPPGRAWAFSLVSMQPHYDRFKVYTTEPLVLVFSKSLDAATVVEGAVTVTNLRTGGAVAGALAVSETNKPDDTITFTPDGRFPFGRRLRVVIGDGLRDADGGSFTGALPKQGVFVANIPNNFDEVDGTDFLKRSTTFLGYDPYDPEATDPSQITKIPGMSVTEAWKMTTGEPTTLIAVLDDGLESLTDTHLLDNLYLNKGELPQPRDADGVCPDWDCNGDGRFNYRDYANDPRVSDSNNNGWIDVEDVFNAFEDGADNDGNGLIDDISGWDFFRNVNRPLGVQEFPEGDHGAGIAKDAAGVADNGQGDAPGTCPDCTVVMVRIGDAVATELNIAAAGVDYARSLGADVVAIANGTFDYSEGAAQAFVDAFEAGVFVAAASGDELGFQHIFPAAGEDVYSLKAVLPIAPYEIFGPLNLSLFAFVESYCTNYGAGIQTAVSSDQCTSTATGSVAGIAGLIVSWAREQGYELSAGEVRQLLNMTADDIKSNCFAFNLGGCKPGWDQNFGYGRVNAKSSLLALGDEFFGTEALIPPMVRITAPLWWETIDPTVTPSFQVAGQIDARGRPYQYVVEVGLGVEPDDADFIPVGTGNGAATTDGPLATVDAASLVSAAWLRRTPDQPNDFTVTVRVRAGWNAGKAQVVGEARKAIALHADDDPRIGLSAGFPIDLGAGGESSVALYDLDGDLDGAPEIIFATSHPSVEVYKRNRRTGEFEPAPGFPVELPRERLWDNSVLASPAVGPLFGDGVPYIVIATWYGKVYVIHPDGAEHPGGPFLAGFPVSTEPVDNSTPLSYGHGNSFVASPVLADFDLDGMLEVAAAASDQKAYVWRPIDEDGDGAADLLPGWPVPLDSSQEAGLVPHSKQCEADGPAQVLGTPAVGILDPENESPDISGHPALVVATTETCNEGLLPTSRVYAVYWNGLDNAEGPFLPGWPAEPLAPLGDALPIPPLTVGSTSSPAAIRWNGELLVSVGSFFWFPQMIHWSGEDTFVQHLKSRFNIGISAGGAFARYDGSDQPWFFFPTAGFLHGEGDDYYLESFNVAGWRLDGGFGAPQLLKHLDDINFFINPVIADLDADGLGELLAGSGGYLIHAVNYKMEQPAGWPKFTHGWMTGSPAVGDIDGDGLLEVVAFTHEGKLFAWNTVGNACSFDEPNGDWPRFHHDPYNTGFYGADATPPAMTTDLRVFTTANPDLFEIHFTAPGDDGPCGFAALYDLRFTTDATADLRDLDVWQTAAAVEAPAPAMGGSSVVAKVAAPGAASFAVRAYDDQNLMSPISNAATPEAPPADDDDDDDDDNQPTDSGDDDDGDKGCGC
jgi:hypothetical protein